MNTHYRIAIVAEIAEWSSYRLANEAGCVGPDSLQSEGALFLDRVRDATLEAIADIDSDDIENADDDGRLHQVADDAPSVYTWTKWRQFVDLGAWQEDPAEFGEITDMDSGASVALYQIAERLISAIVVEISKAVEADQEAEDLTTVSDGTDPHAADSAWQWSDDPALRARWAAYVAGFDSTTQS